MANGRHEVAIPAGSFASGASSSLLLACLYATLAPTMAIKPTRPLGNLLADARQTLQMGQREFGHALGSSHRSATRWDAGQASPGEHELKRLAALLLPHDHALAAEAASHVGETLEDLGLVPRPAPPKVTPPEGPTQADLVDIVVCAAAEATDTSPRAMRSLLHVAFRRARQVGLTVETVEHALAPPAVAVEEKAAKKKS